MYLSGHVPDKYTITRVTHRNAAAKSGPQAGTKLSKGIQRSDSLTAYFGVPAKSMILRGCIYIQNLRDMTPQTTEAAP